MVAGCDFRAAKYLTHLQLVNCTFNAFSPAGPLPVWFPDRLEVLQINGAKGMKLEEQVLPHLDRLEIGNCSKPQEIVEKLLHEGPVPGDETVAHNINTDDMWAEPGTNQQVLGGPTLHDAPPRGFSKLKTFKIECKPWLAAAFNSIMRREDDLELTLTHPRLSEIDNLVLVGGGIDDTLMESVFEKWRTFSRTLSQIAFDSARISGTSIKLLLDEEKNLKTIWLVNCDCVGLDAVEWAQGRGVVVQVRRK